MPKSLPNQPKQGHVYVVKAVNRETYQTGVHPQGEYNSPFLWPRKGSKNPKVTSPDWDPKKECGGGLHAWLIEPAMEIGACSENLEICDFLVLEVPQDQDFVHLGGKIKFKTGRVVAWFSDWLEAHNFARASEAISGYGGTATAGYGGTATAGYGGTATAGYGGTATAGDSGTATAGYGGTATAGYGGTATAGTRGTATAGTRGTATAGTRGTATAGYGGTATAGYGGTATAGDSGTATAGYGGTATAGDSGTATAGTRGTATAGDSGTATAGTRGTATAGDGGTVSIQYWDSEKQKYRRKVAEVETDGPIKPDKRYRLDENLQFVEVTE